jgi:xanthine/uracil permease
MAQSVVCHFEAGEWMKFLSSMVVIGIIAWAKIQFDNRWIRLLSVPVAVVVGLAVFTFTGNSDEVYEVWPMTVGLALGVYFLPWRKWLQKDKDKLLGKAKTRERD